MVATHTEATTITGLITTIMEAITTEITGIITTIDHTTTFIIKANKLNVLCLPESILKTKKTKQYTLKKNKYYKRFLRGIWSS